MQTINRWRKWQPQAEKSGELARTELTQPTKPISVSSVGAIPEESSDFSGSPADDLDELRAPFVQWIDGPSCVVRPRWFSNVNPLLLDFCETEIAAGRVPPNRDEFVRLLNEVGALVAEVEDAVLVSGLVLRQDVEAFEASGYKHPPATKPDASKKRAMRATGKARRQ